MAVTRIRKSMDKVRKSKKDLSQAEIQLQCSCPHTKHGDVTLIQMRERGPHGEIPWKCDQCEKKVNMAKIDDQTLDAAVRTLDQAIDTIKVCMRFRENEADSGEQMELLRMLAKTQFRLTQKIPMLYRAALRGGDRKKKQQHGSGNKNSGWGTPQKR